MSYRLPLQHRYTPPPPTNQPQPFSMYPPAPQLQYAPTTAGPVAFPSSTPAQFGAGAGAMIPGLGLALGTSVGQGQSSGQNPASWAGFAGPAQVGRTPTQSRSGTLTQAPAAGFQVTSANMTSGSSNPASKPPPPQPVHESPEEGELSDPNFDDLYEPDEPAPPVTAATAAPSSNVSKQPAPALSVFDILPPDSTTGARSNNNKPPPPPAPLAPPAGPLYQPDPPSMPSAFRIFSQMAPQPQLHPQQQRAPPRGPNGPNGHAQRARSKSYSPHLSPLHPHPGLPQPGPQPGPQAQSRKSKRSAKKAKKRQSLLAASEAAKAVEKNSNRACAIPAPTAPTAAAAPNQTPVTSPKTVTLSWGAAMSSGTATTPNTATSSGTASLPEARINAQAAVLHLLPLGVTLQDFVDEGIDEAVIRRVFKNLGLNTDPLASRKSNAALIPPSAIPSPSGVIPPPPIAVPSNKASASAVVPPIKAPVSSTAPPTKSTQPQQPPTPGQPSQTVPKPPKPTSPVVSTPATAAAAAKAVDKSGEERKDRIARLLAAKAARGGATPTLASAPSPKIDAPPSAQAPTTASPTSLAQPSSVQVPAGAVPGPSAALANTVPAAPRPATTTMLLVPGKPSSKEARAPPNVLAQSNAPTADKPALSKSDLLQQKLEALKRKQEAEKKGPIVPLPSAAVSVSAAPQLSQVPPLGPNIPGLFTSVAGPSLIQRSSRKRPVAADFVSDSPPGPAKRPLFSGHDKPLIIDVSDESGDDEDVDMAATYAPSDGVPLLARRASALEEARPHSTRVGVRALPSPGSVSSAATAASSPNPQLALMKQNIEDMKRKIALAEARRKAKQASGPTSVAATSNRSSKSPSAPPLVAVVEDSAALGASKIPLRRAHTMTGTGVPESLPSATPPPISHVVAPENRSLTPDQSQRWQRSRLASEGLTAVEAALLRKRSRLEQLRLEIAQLEGEVDEDSKEQERLKSIELMQPGEAKGGEQPITEPDVAAKSRQQPTQEADAMAISPVEEKTSEQAYPTDESASVAVGGPATLDTIPSAAVVDAMQEAVDALESRPSPAVHPAPPPEEADVDVSSAATDLSSDQISQDGTDAIEDESMIVDDVAVDVESAHSEKQQPHQLDTDDNAVDARDEQPQAQVSSSAPAEASRVQPDARSQSLFVPYESPLKCFRSFRFHPEFPKSVNGGLRSLTYSNKIVLDRAFCSQELLEGACADRKGCLYQHFDAIKMPDNQILIELGNYEPQGDDKQVQYINGLRQLLASLRTQAKDFNLVAQTVVEYRRKFQQGPTWVLPLGAIDL